MSLVNIPSVDNLYVDRINTGAISVTNNAVIRTPLDDIQKRFRFTLEAPKNITGELGSTSQVYIAEGAV